MTASAMTVQLGNAICTRLIIHDLDGQHRRVDYFVKAPFHAIKKQIFRYYLLHLGSKVSDDVSVRLSL